MKMVMKTVFFSVVYPSVEPFLSDFFQSLEMQTSRDFSIVLVNDGVVDVERFLERFNPARITILKSGASPVENRMIGIRHALKTGAEYLVFGDSDDFFSANRVETSVELLGAGWDVVVNDLTAVDSAGEGIDSNYLSRRVEDGAEIDFPFIRDKNLFGLSNTAVRTSLLKGAEAPHDLVAVDWYLFSALLREGCRAVFTSKACTFYRQHDANTVGVGALEEDAVVAQLDAKVRHYQAMQYDDVSLYESTLKGLRHQPKLIPEYVDYLKRHAKETPLWWENILPWKKCYEM